MMPWTVQVHGGLSYLQCNDQRAHIASAARQHGTPLRKCANIVYTCMSRSCRTAGEPRRHLCYPQPAGCHNRHACAATTMTHHVP